ncbi:MAG: uroporphyrinogen-III synthase [Acidimicrobiia bacterium]
MTSPPVPLAGRRVATTRDRPGRLDELLRELGADVVHVPLIEIVDAPGDDLAAELDRLDEFDWLVVTSQHGAARVGVVARGHPRLRTAAVGTRTAEVLGDLTGRAVTVVPARQTAADLVVAMPEPTPDTRRVLVAVADRAEPTLVDGLRGRGYDVRSVVAYVNRLRRPTEAERALLGTVDAVAFASGSAARAWADGIGGWTPPHVVAIGPSTARVAADVGLQVTAIAADHSVEGLAAEVTAALGARP